MKVITKTANNSRNNMPTDDSTGLSSFSCNHGRMQHFLPIDYSMLSLLNIRDLEGVLFSEWIIFIPPRPLNTHIFDMRPTNEESNPAQNILLQNQFILLEF